MVLTSRSSKWNNDICINSTERKNNRHKQVNAMVIQGGIAMM